MPTLDGLTNLFGSTIAARSEQARAILAVAPEGAVGGVMARFRRAAADLAALGLAGRLEAMRADLGDDQYRLIAAGPNLAEMVEAWVVDRKKAICDVAIADLVAVAKEANPGVPLSRPHAAAYFGAILVVDPVD